MSGRSKLVIKPKGYQVFPTEVENFIINALKEKVASVAVVGAKQEVFTEVIIAFVQPKPGAQVTVEEVNVSVKDIAAYKRPTHVEILEDIPLNRVSKTDYVSLKTMAKNIADRLRIEGKWDA